MIDIPWVGHSAFARIPYLPSSSAAERTSPLAAAYDAVYIGNPGSATNADADVDASRLPVRFLVTIHLAAASTPEGCLWRER